MTINFEKTQRFGNKAHLKKKLDNKPVRYLDTPLERKDKAKYLFHATFQFCAGRYQIVEQLKWNILSLFDPTDLRVLSDKKMQWKYQIRNITQKVNLNKLQYFHYLSLAWTNAAPFRLNKINKRNSWCFRFFLGREDNYIIYDMIDNNITCF